jgi:hypothetical protein
MSYFNIHDVDDKNKLTCSQKDTTNFSGVLTCSKYLEPNKTINFGIDYFNGELYQNSEDALPLNYEFNNLNFANTIQNNLNIQNINQCFNPNNCINKELYATKKFKSSELKNNSNFLELCNNNKLCEDYNYTTNNTYLINKVCRGDKCYYSLYCGCDKKVANQ